jgi:hypothetical protein
MAGAQLVKDTSQGGAIGSEEEKLCPEAIRLLFIVVVILIRAKGAISRGGRKEVSAVADIYLAVRCLVHDGGSDRVE